MSRFAFVGALGLLLGACMNECEERPPIIEVQVSGQVDAQRPTLLALRGSSPEWSTVLCDPGGSSALAGVPIWEGSCDLIAVELASVPTTPRLEVQLVTLDAGVGGGLLDLPEGSCETSILPVAAKVEANDPNQLPEICGLACASDCFDDGSSPTECINACLIGTNDAQSCVAEARAQAHCLARLDCDWHAARASGLATPCAPFDNAIDACLGAATY